MIKDLNKMFSGMGGMKLLEELIRIANPREDAKEIMKPFFVLYDFRLILDHDYPEERRKEKLNFCYERLGIPKDKSHFEMFYDKLLEELTKSYSKMTNALLS